MTDTETEAKTSRPIPPYVPFKTFKSFIDGLRELGGTPGRIDRSLMRTQSGAIQGQLMAAIRYLDLITSNGTPTDYLRRLVAAKTPDEQKAALHDVLTHGYPFLFASTEFDARHATSSQLASSFSSQGATGETVRKCVAFLLLAASEANYELSPFFKTGRAPRGAGQRARRAAKPDATTTQERQPLRASPPPWEMPAGLRKEIQGALAQLPDGEAALTLDEIEDLVTVYRIALKRAYLSRD